MSFAYILLAIIGSVIGFMIAMRLYIQWKSSAIKGKPAPTLDGKAGKILKKGRTALFYFYSPACGACKAMTPAVKKMSAAKDNVFTIDISHDMGTARKFGVMATPTVIVVENRVVKNILIGPQPPAVLENHLG